ncbi:MAG TPA: T9SS type A sorting domain-containing protein [Chitinispirillaceae bacterium]|nr:T9SS type A sorting domain-containing protein [Chitinispirillaceae bacterium]
MNKLLIFGACCMASLTFSTSAKNYWNWDCESLKSASSRISGFDGTSKLVTTDPRSGKYCLQHESVGNDNGNQQAGAKVGGYDIGSLLDGKWLYYRWWMKIDEKFKFGNRTAKIKANRIKLSSESSSPPLTGYIAKDNFHVSGNQGCIPKHHWDEGGPKIPFDLQGMAGKGWHEYIIAIKKQNGVNGLDGEFHLYVDGKEIGNGVKNLRWTNLSASCNEAWMGWMVRPYFQLNGTSSDGGLMWIDDISTDDTWNSTLVNIPGEETGISPVSNKNVHESALSIHPVNNRNIQFTVKLLQPENINLNLFDLYGRKIWSYSNAGRQGSNNIIMTKCAPGQYIMKMDLEKARISESKTVDVLK